MKIRGCDKHGCGHYGASRGDRTHKGVDIVCDRWMPVKSIGEGIVTKVGYPYGDDLSYRYVEITDSAGARWRYFYVCPLVCLGSNIAPGDTIGQCQDIAARYEGITPHWHLEIINGAGDYIDPTGFVVDVG